LNDQQAGEVAVIDKAVKEAEREVSKRERRIEVRPRSPLGSTKHAIQACHPRMTRARSEDDAPRQVLETLGRQKDGEEDQSRRHQDAIKRLSQFTDVKAGLRDMGGAARLGGGAPPPPPRHRARPGAHTRPPGPRPPELLYTLSARAY
jgi:hypothetical protein